MKKILCVIDMQNDFVSGALANKNAQAIVPYVVEKVRSAAARADTTIFFTQDTHSRNGEFFPEPQKYLPSYLQTQEGRRLPIEHCIFKTWGWEIIDELQPFLNLDCVRIYQKYAFGGYEMAAAVSKITNGWESKNDEIEIVGLCTDICVIANAFVLKALNPNTPIVIDAKGCAGITMESHANAIKAMQACQFEIRNQ